MSNSEILRKKYANYGNSYSELVNLLTSIIQEGELTEENKSQLSVVNTKYDNDYISVKQGLTDAQEIINDNRFNELKTPSISQEQVFNALTQNGKIQGIYLDEDGELYINSEFLQTRGLKVVNDNNQTTLYIDEEGNLTTSGDIVGGTITGATMNAMTINTNNVNIESEDGGMVLRGALQQFKDSNNKVRIQIGKNSNGDFTFTLFGQNGETVLIDANGIKADAITAGTIIGSHIKGDTIEGKHIKGNVITGGHIQGDSIGAGHIQTGTITAGSGIIANGAIGNAQISSVDAGKISAGKIDTSLVEIAGNNNHLKLKGNRLQVFQGTGNQAKERVSLGDVNGDGTLYGLRVRGADGTTVLIDENGVKSEGITDGSITNEKINENANIDGDKININSVVDKINEDGTKSIVGTKINVGDGSLTAKLSKITEKQIEHTNSITQAQSDIKANEKEISLKVSEQTYTADKKETNTKFTNVNSEISSMKDKIALKVESTDITNAINGLEIGGRNILVNSGNFEDTKNWISNGGSGLKVVNKDGFSCLTATGSYRQDQYILEPNSTYIYWCEIMFDADVEVTTTTPLHFWLKQSNKGATISANDPNGGNVEVIKGGGTIKANTWHKIISRITTAPHVEGKQILFRPFIYKQSFTENWWLKYIKLEKGNKDTDWTSAPEDTQSQIDSINTNLTTNYSTTTQMNSAITASKESIELGVSKKYATTQSVTDVANSLKNNYSTTTDMNAAIKASSDSITSSVSKTYASKEEVKNLNIGTRNRLKGTSEDISFTGTNTVNQCKTLYYFDSSKSDIVGQTLSMRFTYTVTNYVSGTIYIQTQPNKYIQLSNKITPSGNGTFTVDYTTGKFTSDEFTSTQLRLDNFQGTVTISKMMLVTGDKPCDWEISPDDIDGLITSKGYQTASDVQQKVNELQIKFSESGGYNWLYNGDFRRGFEKWNNNGGTYETTLSCPANQKGIRIVGEIGKTKYFSQGFSCDFSEPFTLSFWQYTSTGTDGTTNPFRKPEMTITYTDGTKAYFGTSHQQKFGTWEKMSVTVKPTKRLSYINVSFFNRDTTRSVYYTNIMLEKGSIVNDFSPNPNEIFDGITTIDKDGITVTASNVKSKTSMSANGFKITKTDTNEDVFKVNADGTLALKGQMTITGGSVSDSAISSTIKNGASAGTSAKNQVDNWTYSGSTEINGNSIRTGTLSASKITTGTLDATKVSVTNLNATNIKSGTIDAARISADTLKGKTITGGTISGGTVSGATVTGGSLSIGSNFSVNSSGVLTAKSASFTGTINSGSTINGSNIRGGTLYIAADSSATNGYAFRIYDDGRVFSKKTIQVYGSAENGVYSQLTPGRVTATEFAQTPAIKTSNSVFYIGINDVAVVDPQGDNANRLEFKEISGNKYFRPCYPSVVRNGSTSYMWYGVYSLNGVSSSSDRNMKENIHYLNRNYSSANASPMISNADMFDFIKNDYILAQYNYIGHDDTKISGIAQDLLIDEEGNDNIVGQLIVNNEEALKDKKENGDGFLSINQTQLLNVTIGALQEAMTKIEALEKEVSELKNKKGDERWK